MTPDPAFVARCEATAAMLRQLADLGARPDADPGDLALAERVAADLLADPEALLAVALTIEQQRARAAREPAVFRVEPAGAAPAGRPDDLGTLRRGETRLAGGKMWARCEDCGFVGPLAGLGTWHVCDPVTDESPLTEQAS